jgi:hypothetical protein
MKDNMRELSEFRPISVSCGPVFRGANPAKTVTVSVSMRINEQLYWVALLAEGQGAV